MTDAYLGRWILVPELSLYQFGLPPKCGTYVIARSGQKVHVEIHWTPAEGSKDLRIDYGGPVDGTRQPVPSPGQGGPDSFCLTRVDRRTLDSTAFTGEEATAFARRVASEDGLLLAVVQEGTTPDGQAFRNFQIYRRQEQESSDGAV